MLLAEQRGGGGGGFQCGQRKIKRQDRVICRGARKQLVGAVINKDARSLASIKLARFLRKGLLSQAGESESGERERGEPRAAVFPRRSARRAGLGRALASRERSASDLFSRAERIYAFEEGQGDGTRNKCEPRADGGTEAQTPRHARILFLRLLSPPTSPCATYSYPLFLVVCGAAVRHRPALASPAKHFLSRIPHFCLGEAAEMDTPRNHAERYRLVSQVQSPYTAARAA